MSLVIVWYGSYTVKAVKTHGNLTNLSIWHIEVFAVRAEIIWTSCINISGFTQPPSLCKPFLDVVGVSKASFMSLGIA